MLTKLATAALAATVATTAFAAPASASERVVVAPPRPGVIVVGRGHDYGRFERERFERERLERERLERERAERARLERIRRERDRRLAWERAHHAYYGRR